MKREDVLLLAQLARALEELVLKLEEYYEKKDVEKFGAVKREILMIQRKISEGL